MRFTSKLLGALLLLLSVAARAETLSYTTYYHNDHLGSPVAATDEQGAVLWRAHFRPYGERQENPKDTNFGSVGYTGHAQDADSGMVYMQARYYDPLIGRFMAVDPVGVNPNATTTFNRYAYANNNPHRFVDPNGESGVTAFGGLLSESGQFLMGNGFDGAMVAGALADGYNGEGGGFASAAFEDATSFIPAGAVGGVLIKLSRLSKTSKFTNNVIESKRTKHMFRDKEGHLSDTPENRKLLERIANTRKTTLGDDKFGNTWSAQTRSDGTQVWTQTRDGKIINGGVNQTPKTFDKNTGLSAPAKPRQ